MKKSFIIILISFAFGNLFSQEAPGYMGKKLVIEYSAIGAPSLFRVNSNGNSGIDLFPPGFKFPMNYGHKITGTYSINRKASYGASIEMYKTGVDYSGVYITQADIEDDRLVESYTYNGRYAVLNSYGLTLFKSFYSNGISPLGRHQNFGLKILYSTTDLSSIDFNAYNNNNYNNSIAVDVREYQAPSKSPSSLNWGLTYGVGINRILFDRLVFNIGFEVALMVSALSEWGEDWNTNYDFTDYTGVTNSGLADENRFNKNLSTESELHKKMGSERVFTSQFFNLKIGIGFLAY